MKNGQLLQGDDLEKVTGGVYDAEAQKWIDRNKETIYSRAAGNESLLDFALSYGERSSTVYTVDMIKSTLKNYGLNVDDLD